MYRFINSASRLVLTVLLATPLLADNPIRITPNPLPNGKESAAYDQELRFSQPVIEEPYFSQGYTFKSFSNASIADITAYDPANTSGVPFSASALGLTITLEPGTTGRGIISGTPAEGCANALGDGPTTYVVFVSVKYVINKPGDLVGLTLSNVSDITTTIEGGAASEKTWLEAAVEGEPYSAVNLPYIPSSGVIADSAGGLPDGLALNTDGSIGGTPQTGSAGEYVITIHYHETILSGFVPTTYYYPSLTLALNVVKPHEFDTVNIPDATEHLTYEPLSLQLSGGTAPYTFGNIDGLPPGMMIAADGTLSGTPFCGGAEHGAYTATFDVTDSTTPSPLTTIFVFTLNVSGPEVTIETSALPVATEGVAYITPLKISGVIASLSMAATGLPAGLLIGKHGGVWAIMGTPKLGTAGGYALEVTANETDQYASHSVSRTFAFNVEGGASGDLRILNNYLPDGQEGEVYGPVTLSATGGESPYRFDASGLPEGLRLFASSGVIAGKPAAGSAGNSVVVIATTDAAGDTASIALMLYVAPAAATDGSSETSLDVLSAELVADAPASCMLTGTSGVPALMLLTVLLWIGAGLHRVRCDGPRVAAPGSRGMFAKYRNRRRFYSSSIATRCGPQGGSSNSGPWAMKPKRS
ncbi:MAG: putative Ig domain-containing protein [Planctomycetes bacterium]|nr:putative Ig domain-containing protein [Planctomycetota bacterium]NUQ33422.1 putative Ig domain-containing protein [Planctomycetaceae bacterium]